MHLDEEYMSWLGELYRQHNVMLLRVARFKLGCYTGSQAGAEDVVQDVFVTAAGKDIRAEKNPVGWLVVTTVNICRNRYHRQTSDAAKEKMYADRMIVSQPSRYSRLSEGAQDDEAEAVSLELSLQKELTAEEYRLFHEYFVEGQSIAALSERVGTTPGALRVRLCRLKKKAEKIFPLVVVIFLVTQYI